MEQAEGRLMMVIPLAMGMVMVLLYLAFRSLIDVLLVLSNVVALCCGGVWALLLTHTNFSISAAVGFISIFGVAVMNGLLQVSSFNRLRLEGKPLEEAVLGLADRLRPMMMTALTAIFGLLPAAFSTRIGGADATAAGHRGDRRHAGGRSCSPLSDAGPLQPLPPGNARSGVGPPSRIRGEHSPNVPAGRTENKTSKGHVLVFAE